MNKKITISAVDLFCGIGGLTYGLKRAGIPVVAGIDINETCRFAFEKNNKAVFINKNIKEFKGSELGELFSDSKIRILVGCAPCQPFSKHTHKNRQKSKDKEWGLLYDFLNLVKETKPTIISMENVPQITKHEVFHDFVKDLESFGYHVFWKPIFCPNYGIPQNRTRLVLLASLLGSIEILPPTHKTTQYKTVKDAISKLEPIKAGETSKNDPLHRSCILSPINLKRIKHSKPGGSWKEWDPRLRAKCHQKKTGKTYYSVYARMSWDKPSPTITTQFFSFGTGRFGHPEQNRALSIREGAILQTFPKKYKFIPSASVVELKKLGKHIGNAVPVRLGEIIGKSIIKHIKKHHD